MALGAHRGCAGREGQVQSLAAGGRAQPHVVLLPDAKAGPSVCLSLEQSRETLGRVLSLPPGVLDLNKIFPKGSMNRMTLSQLIQLFRIIVIF